MKGKRSHSYLSLLEQMLVVREEKRDNLESRYARQLVSEETHDILLSELNTAIELIILLKGSYLVTHEEEGEENNE